MNTIGFFCLAVWQILMGALQGFDVKFANRDKIMGVLAIIAGVTMFITALRM